VTGDERAATVPTKRSEGVNNARGSSNSSSSTAAAQLQAHCIKGESWEVCDDSDEAKLHAHTERKHQQQRLCQRLWFWWNEQRQRQR